MAAKFDEQELVEKAIVFAGEKVVWENRTKADREARTLEAEVVQAGVIDLEDYPEYGPGFIVWGQDQDSTIVVLTLDREPLPVSLLF